MSAYSPLPPPDPAAPAGFAAQPAMITTARSAARTLAHFFAGFNFATSFILRLVVVSEGQRGVEADAAASGQVQQRLRIVGAGARAQALYCRFVAAGLHVAHRQHPGQPHERVEPVHWHSAIYASGFIMWSPRRMWLRSWARTHSLSRSPRPSGRYIFGRRMPATKAVPIPLAA